MAATKLKTKRSPIADLKASGVAAALARVGSSSDELREAKGVLELAIAERDTRIQEMAEEHASEIADVKAAFDKATEAYRADVESARDSGRRGTLP